MKENRARKKKKICGTEGYVKQKHWNLWCITLDAVSKTTKIKAACYNLERGFKKQKEIVKDILKLPDNSQLETKEIVTDKDIQKKADDFDRLMLLIKDKLNDNLLKTHKKAQILTMAPDWTRARIAEYLDVSEYMVHEARKLARKKGILALPEPKRDKCL